MFFFLFFFSLSFCDEDGDGETSCRECTRAAAKIVLLVINTVWILAGLGMCAGGAVAFTWTEQFAGLIDTTSILVVAILGGFLFLVGIMGCWSVFHLGCKSIQMVYGLLVLVLAIAMAGAGAAILSYLGAIDGAATGLASANAAQETSKEYIDNYLNCMYNKCCNSNSTDITFVLADCDGAKTGTQIQEGICVSLDKIQAKECGELVKFKSTIQLYIAGYLNVFMLAVFSVAGLQFVGFLLSCCFLWSHYSGGEQIYATG